MKKLGAFAAFSYGLFVKVPFSFGITFLKKKSMSISALPNVIVATTFIPKLI